MTDPTLIAELRQHAEWARAESRQSQTELFDRAADALEGKPPEIRRNDNGTLDEIVAKNATIHLEQMHADQWWIGITSGGKTVNVWLRRAKRLVVADVEERS